MRARVTALVLAAVVIVAACSSGAPRARPTSTTALVPLTSVPTATAPASTTTAVAATTTTAAAACVAPAAIASWPVARRAGLLVVVPALDFDVASVAPALRAGAGGVLFLGTAAAPSDLASRLRSTMPPASTSGAPFVMADVEGGGVQRLAPVVEPFPWPRDLAATESPAQVEQLAARVGREMRAAGVTVDLAPVLDLDDRAGPSASNPDGRRSFSLDPSTTTTYGSAFVRGLRAAGVLPVVKHFPGLGGSTTNTDFGPAPTQPLATLRAAGLVPFTAAIKAGAPAVMVANASVPGLTPLPATLSHATITGLLRGELGFHGLVVTDSLSAGAVRAAGYDVPHAAAASITAGADVILYGSTLTPNDVGELASQRVTASFTAIVDAITAAVARGTLSSARLDDAVAHVLTAKGIAVCSS